MFGAIGSSGSLGMGCVLTLVDDFSANAATAEASMQRLGLSVDGVANRIDTGLARIKKGAIQMGIGLALLMPFAAAANEAAKFEQQLSSIQAVTKATTEQMLIAKNAAMEFGPAMGFSATESAKGIEELVKAGVDFSRIANGEFKDALTLAVAGEISLTEASEVASVALNSFKDDGLSIKNVADIMAGAANASATDMHGLRFSLQAVSAVAAGMGFSFKDTNVALAVLAQNGLKGSDAGTSLKAMLQNLQPTTKKEIELFRELGLTLKNGQNQFLTAEGGFKSMADISQVLHDKLANLTVANRAKAMERIFGTDAVRAANILFKEGAVGLNNMAIAMDKVSAQEAAMEKLNNLNGQWKILKAEFLNTAIVIGDMFLPVLKAVVAGLRVLNGLLQSMAKSAVGAFVLKVVAATGAIILLAGAFDVVRGAITVMWATAAPALAGLWAALLPLLPVLIPLGVAIGIMVKGWQSFKEVLNGNTEVANGFLGFLQRIGGAMYAIGAVWSSWDGKTFDLGGMEETFQKMGILEQMKALGTWIVRIKELFVGMFDAIAWGFSAAYDMIKAVWDDVISPMFDALGIDLEKLTANIEIFKYIGRAIGAVIGIPIAAIGALFATAMATVATASTLIGGAIYCIGQTFGWAIGKIQDFFSWFANLPSIWEVFTEMGSNLGAAIYDGLVAFWLSIKDGLLSTLMNPLYPLLAAIDYVAGTNLSGSNGQLQPALATGNAGKVNQMVNYNNTMKAQPQFSSAYIDKTVTNTQVKEVNLHLDGDLMYKHMVDKGNLDNARE